MNSEHWLGGPGTQPRRAHLEGWEMHAAATGRRVHALLDRFGSVLTGMAAAG